MLSPLLSLLFVLCLISPDFATCSLELHKHVVIDVIKRLSTFKSLELSNLAPMFFVTSIRESQEKISYFSG